MQNHAILVHPFGTVFQSPNGENGNAIQFRNTLVLLRSSTFQSPTGENGNAITRQTFGEVENLPFQSPTGENGNAISIKPFPYQCSGGVSVPYRGKW